MRKFSQMFIDSAKEFRNLKSIILAAILLAIHTVLSFFLSIPVTDTLKISVAFIANCVTGLLLGPVVGFVCGGAGDIISFILKPTGPFFPGWTISAALAGLVYGIAFYRQYPKNIVQEKSDEDSHVVNYKIYRAIQQVLLAAGMILWFLAPFLTITTKASAEQPERAVIFEGTAFSAVKEYFGVKDAAPTSCILAVLILAVLVVLFVLNFTKRTLAALFISVFGAFGIMLSVYTDKNTVTGEYGFFLFAGILCVCVLLDIMILLYQRSIDASYMLRCFIAMAIVAVFINAILGTYWITIMTGKGFMVYFTMRAVKNLIQLPINTVLAYLVIRGMKRLKGRMNL